MKHEEVDAILPLSGVVFFANRMKLVRLAHEYQMPGVYMTREFTDDGGLMSYASSIPTLARRAAVYADKILKGTKPADLPIEQPMRFDLVINLKTAQALGLTIPYHVLVQATEFIQ